MAQSSRQDILKRWLEARTAIQELLALGLEQKHPWLLAIKQIVGIKAPEGPKAAKVPRTAILLEVPVHQVKKPVKKHRTGRLMLKAKRQALEKFKRFH
jgi:hypothetical protein